MEVGPKLAGSMSLAALEERAPQTSALLGAMLNSARLLVPRQPAEGEKSVGELERAVGLGQSGLSQHLAVLRAKSIVATRRAGQSIYHRPRERGSRGDSERALQRVLRQGSRAGRRETEGGPRLDAARRPGAQGRRPHSRRPSPRAGGRRDIDDHRERIAT